VSERRHGAEGPGTGPGNEFPAEAAGLPRATSPPVIDLGDGDRYELRVAPVSKVIDGTTVRMLAYNGSIPGPTLRVPQGAEIDVHVVNEGDVDATVHWHGLRLENRFDGTHETQRPIAVGESFTARVSFPDPGLYWYHPHIRQDYGQEMGLYGNCLVVPPDPDYWPPAHREILLTLDDVLLEGDRIAPFSRSGATHVAMGRFGDVLLIAGQVEPALAARPGEVVRLFLTNTANARVFRIALPGARLKLVGGDSGRVEREELVEDVILAPSERVVVDALFEADGDLALEHRTPEETFRLATITVAGPPVEDSTAERFALLRSDPELTGLRDELGPWLTGPPARTLSFVAEMELAAPGASGEGTFACPMHPDVVGGAGDRCPRCGMALVPAELLEEAGPSDHHGHAHEHTTAPGDHQAGGIEWEDDMAAVNRITTPANTRWLLIDKDTGARGAAIDWRFRVGDRVKIRLVNEMESDHPMHHPFHVHGAGRFLILSRDGVTEPNLVWKDTVLVRTGEVVDILLDVTNPGLWMAHCHIAEHHESGMMFSFRVDPAEPPR
jgi:FtsP/CotA-like multicopper oxidase with cupredoxin domain